MTRHRKTIDCGKADTVQHQQRVSFGDTGSGCLRACIHKSGSVIDVRFTPDATKLLRSGEMTRCANHGHHPSSALNRN